jgi:hypothetical protein
LREVARTINDPDYLGAVVDQAIQRQPTFDDECSRIFCDFRARGANPGMFRQQVAAFLYAVVNVVGDSLGTTRRDIEPDIQKVFAGAACESNPAHALTL